MPLLTKVLGSGIGLASEAIHKAREGKSKERSSSNQDQSSNDQAASSSSPQLPPPHYESQPPQYYTELPDEASLQSMSHNQSNQYSQYGQHDKNFVSSVNEAEIHQDALTQDEAVWELDEASESMRPETEQDSIPAASEPEEETIKKREAMVRNLVAMAGPTPQPTRRLPCPVIIPQRRPRKKDRGFVRAYAPVLQDCGISEEVFIQFLNDFDAANKASKWLEVVFVAAGIVGFVPNVAAQVTSAVVQVVAGTAKELQGRQRGNTFLDRVNQDLLMPRGLFGMVMAFKDKVPGQQSGPLGQLSGTIQQTFFTSERLSIDETVAKHANPDPNMSKFKKGLNDIRLTSGKTYGDVELPASAPLVYPELDRAAKTLTTEGGDQAPKSGVIDKFKNAGEWTADYLDRRAHVFYEAEHPGTSLAVSGANQRPMKSRFNDPNHAANSGSLISVLTGGHIAAPSPLNRVRGRGGRGVLGRGRGGGIGFGGLSRVLQGSSPETQQPQHSTSSRGGGGLLKKVFQKDVFYLLIVNLPTEEEIQQSVHDLEQIIGQDGATRLSR